MPEGIHMHSGRPIMWHFYSLRFLRSSLLKSELYCSNERTVSPTSPGIPGPPSNPGTPFFPGLPL